MTTEPTAENAASWHDNLIYAIEIRAPDPENGDWRSDLVLDIDHIVEWICDADGRVKFRVAPATLVFHDVTDLKIQLDMGAASFGMADATPLALNELSIDVISKTRAPHPGQMPSLPYHQWRIALNLPRNGELSFGASGYTQTLRAEPLLLDEQRLAPRDRPPFGPAKAA
jgi:hypothetical protein